MGRPTRPFLLMYESHGMRHIGFPQVDGGQRDPRDRDNPLNKRSEILNM